MPKPPPNPTNDTTAISLAERHRMQDIALKRRLVNDRRWKIPTEALQQLPDEMIDIALDGEEHGLVRIAATKAVIAMNKHNTDLDTRDKLEQGDFGGLVVEIPKRDE